MRLEGKVALIAGSGSGIGRACALLFAEQGASVAIVELREDWGGAVQKEIDAMGRSSIFVQTDISSEEAVKQAVAKTVAAFGHIDVLVNCAGGALMDDAFVRDVDMSVWDHTISVDLKGTLLTCKHTIPELVKGPASAIVNISSWTGLVGSPFRNVYVAAKGGVISFTKALAAELSPLGVRANVVCPGGVATPFIAKKYDNADPREPKIRYRNDLMRRYPFSYGKPIDIANVVLFLASNEARMITGATIAADGGRSTLLPAEID